MLFVQRETNKSPTLSHKSTQTHTLPLSHQSWPQFQFKLTFWRIHLGGKNNCRKWYWSFENCNRPASDITIAWGCGCIILSSAHWFLNGITLSSDTRHKICLTTCCFFLSSSLLIYCSLGAIQHLKLQEGKQAFLQFVSHLLRTVLSPLLFFSASCILLVISLCTEGFLMSLFFRAYALPSCFSNFLTVFIGTLYGGAIQQTRLHVGRHRCLQRGLQEPQESFDPTATMKSK